MKRSLFYHFCYLIFSRLSFEMFELENELWKKRKIGPLKVDSNLKLARKQTGIHCVQCFTSVYSRKQTGIHWGKTLYTRNNGANTFKRLNFRTGKIRGDSHAKKKYRTTYKLSKSWTWLDLQILSFFLRGCLNHRCSQMLRQGIFSVLTGKRTSLLLLFSMRNFTIFLLNFGIVNNTKALSTWKID